MPQDLFATEDEITPDTAQRQPVLVTSPVNKAYDYAVADGQSVEPGSYVLVPLGPREVIGTVWDADPSATPPKKLKSILHVFDIPPMPKVHRDFLKWVAQYNMADLGSVLKMAIPVPQALDPQKPLTAYVLAERRTPHPTLSPEGRGLEGKARDLRKNQTDVEQKLWLLLRGRRLENYKFRRQHPVKPYIADFACIEAGLIVELDGGQHQDDTKRDQYLKDKGFTVLRFWNNEILENEEGVLTTILKALAPTGRGLGEGSGLNPKQQKIIDLMQDGLPRRQSELIEQGGVTASVVKTMVKHGLLETIDLFASAPCKAPNLNNTHILSPAQREAADQLTARVKAGEFEAFLLDGVTGSGKTEVYFEAIAEAVKRGQQAVILLPEIALSNSFIGRFKERFGVAPALWHSSLSPAQRRVTWRGIVSGETKVVVGARSALFLPYADLGLIVIDEEHDGAFKQEEGVLYNARDMAVVRAHLGKIPAVLVSATPSLETMQNAWAGRYTLLKLPDRFGDADHPDMTVVDLRQDKPERQHFISPVIKDAIAATIERKEQSLLFLNRRGYAPLTLCRTCGHRFECPRCTAWLVEHKKTGKLQCHHCGFATKIPDECPECHDVNSLAVCGPGVERIAEEVKEYFPDARTMILASDVTDTHEKLRMALAAIQNYEVDIIIGTQIIAKGHHFPKLTTVGVIDADLGLSGGDLRASERTFQLLHQVAGRAGREHLKGTVYLQSYAPEHRVIQMIAKDDRDNFLRTEAIERERAKMPPFSRLAGIILTGPNETQVKEIAHTIGKAAPSGEGLRVLGPAPAQMFRIRGNYRYRLLVQADKTINIQKLIADWLEGIKVPSKVKLAVDIDPQSFL